MIFSVFGPSVNCCFYIYSYCFTTYFTIFHSTFSLNLKDKKQFSFSNDGVPPSWNFKISKLGYIGWWDTDGRVHHHAKFRQNWPIRCGDIAIFDFSKWRQPPSPPYRIFKSQNFYWLTESRGPRCLTVPNFIKMGQTVFEISRFFDFSRWRPSAILDLFRAYSDHPQRVLGVIITVQNLVLIDNRYFR